MTGELLPGAATAVHHRTRYTDLANDPAALFASHPIPGNVAFANSVETLDAGNEHLAGLIGRFHSGRASALVLYTSNELILEAPPIDGAFVVDQSVRGIR